MGGLRLDPGQLAVLARLGPLLPASYYLAGGVGVAAHLGHRASRDLNLFGESDPSELLSVPEELPGTTVSNRAKGTLHLLVDGVPVSLLQYRYPLAAEPAHLAEVPLPVASLVDLAGMKLAAIAGRGAARDFWDLHSILPATGSGLDELLAAFRVKFAAVDIGHVVRSLVYFGDAEAEPFPSGLSAEHWAAVKRDLERRVLALNG